MTEFESRLHAQEKDFARRGRERLAEADEIIRVDLRDKPGIALTGTELLGFFVRCAMYAAGAWGAIYLIFSWFGGRK